MTPARRDAARRRQDGRDGILTRHWPGPPALMGRRDRAAFITTYCAALAAVVAAVIWPPLAARLAWLASAFLAWLLCSQMYISACLRHLLRSERERGDAVGRRVLQSAGRFELLDGTSGGVVARAGKSAVVIAHGVSVALDIEDNGEVVRVRLSDIPQGM